MGRGLTSSFRTRGDRRPRQAIIGLPPASQPMMAAPFIGLAGASSSVRCESRGQLNDRGPRTGLTDRRSLNVACDLVFFTTGLISPNSKARVGLRVVPPTLRFGVGSFSIDPQALQRRMGDLSECSKHFLNTCPLTVSFCQRSLSECAVTHSVPAKRRST